MYTFTQAQGPRIAVDPNVATGPDLTKEEDLSISVGGWKFSSLAKMEVLVEIVRGFIVCGAGNIFI